MTRKKRGRPPKGRNPRYNDLIHFQGNQKALAEFYRKRERILERDEWKCTKCGMDELTHWQKTRRGLDVHHINENPLDNRDSNLETICCFCHHANEPNRDWKRYAGLPVTEYGHLTIDDLTEEERRKLET